MSQDDSLMPKKNLSSIKVVSKFNSFTCNKSFDNIFLFRTRIYSEIKVESQEK